MQQNILLVYVRVLFRSGLFLKTLHIFTFQIYIPESFPNWYDIYIYWYKHTPMHTSTHIYTQMHPDIHEYHKLVCPKSYLSIFSLVSVPWTVALWNVSEGVSPINNIKSMKKSQRLHTLHNVTFLHLCLIAFRTLDT